MWEAIKFTGAILGIILPIGVLMVWYLNKCNHAWSLIKDLEIMRPIDGVDKNVGFTKVYECVHCKNIKSETYSL